MNKSERIQFEKLMELARRTENVTCICACSSSLLAGWEKVPVSFPESQMREIGTLVSDVDDDPSFAEFHPSNTSYWSKDAPIAVRHFPYNRCTVWECTECRRCFLRYTEGGGYYVEQRIRSLDSSLIVDAPL